MSLENVETVRRAHAAWESDDLEGFLRELHPYVEWHASIERALEGQGVTYRGHREVRRGWAEYRGEALGRLAIHIDEIRDLGESVLLLGRFTVTGRASTIMLDTEFGQVITLRDGKIATSHDYMSHADALDAAGLSE